MGKKERVGKMEEIYKKAEEFLNEITPSKLRGKELEKYFNVEKKFKSKNEILSRLLASLQNKQMATNVIGFWKDNRQPIFENIFLNYDSDAILNTYKKEDSLFDCFTKHFYPKNAESNRNLWRLYAKSVISACKFISKFKDEKDFDKFVNLFSYNEFSSAALPMVLEKEIFGLGLALACDFLKELGYTQYPKPDVHIKEIFHTFDFCEDNDYSAYKAVIEMAGIVKETPYKVDKIFWLISSGNYYIDGEKIPGNKENFIETIKK